VKQYTLTEASLIIGLSHSTLRHQAQAGRLRAKLIGKTWVVTSAELERYAREVKRPEREATR
jgi:hypothetical protein